MEVMKNGLRTSQMLKRKKEPGRCSSMENMILSFRRVAPFRDQSIDKWQRKTQVTTSAAAIKSKLQAFNQNISEQVVAYMRDPSRMIKQMQQRASTVGIFGGCSWEGSRRLCSCQWRVSAHPDGDPELLDDSEFYQQLLKEIFETIDPTSSDWRTEMA